MAGFMPAAREATCQFSPRPSLPQLWKPQGVETDMTKMLMGLNYLILHAICNSSPARKYLHLKEELQSYITTAGPTRGCQELVN